jgi:beta-glucosidase
MNAISAAPTDLLAALSIEQKVRLLTGADAWTLHGTASIGLRPMVLSDGPAGVRGTAVDADDPSSSLPCPVALGATWDEQLIRELAAALGHEARSKGIDVLLGPTINIIRTPLSGRGFECFSEDPVLTARLAVNYVRGLAEAGVAAAAKHYVGNDSETERRTYDARIPDHVLRELYLVPFEACVKEADVAMVMAAYNSVNGATMTANAPLLRDVLKKEWNFHGVVVSDWHATRSTRASALAGLDLVMPGPEGPWGELLVAAVHAGDVPEAEIDDKLARLLRLAERVGALGPSADDGNGADTPGWPSVRPSPVRTPGAVTHRAAALPARGDDPPEPPERPDVRPSPVRTPGAVTHRAAVKDKDPERPARGGAAAGGAGRRWLVDPALLRRAAARSFVLLRNERDALPLDPTALGSVAVIGPNAIHPQTQGGGSVRVHSFTAPTPAQALRDALPGAAVHAHEGCRTWTVVPATVGDTAGAFRDPVTGEPGLRFVVRGADGSLIYDERHPSGVVTWWDDLPKAVFESGAHMVMRATYRAAVSGPHLVGAAGVGGIRIAVDGALLAQASTLHPSEVVEVLSRPPEVRVPVDLHEGQEAEVCFEYEPAPRAGEGFVIMRLGAAPAPREDDLLAEAVEAARASDVAVVLVGSADGTESEGYDRETMALPGRQDELVSRVAAVNPATIVVVNSGMPVLMKWVDEVAAVVHAWLPGQAAGEALADVLLGAAEPCGRLPVTIPRAETDAPVLHARPRGNELPYSEGLLVGYRDYDRRGREPLFCFGHGLGYTRWEYESATVLARGDDPPRPPREGMAKGDTVFPGGHPRTADGPGLLRGGTVTDVVRPGQDLTVVVKVRNGGGRAGREVIQAYLEGPGDDSSRPLRTLAAFAPVSAGPGNSAEARLTIPARAFTRFDSATKGWNTVTGGYAVHIGRSSRDLPLGVRVVVR